MGRGGASASGCCFFERPTGVDAQAASDALLRHLPNAAVFEEIERILKFARRMIAGPSQRIQRLVRELDRQAVGRGSERFIDYLLRHGRGQAGPFVVTVVTLPAAKA